MVLLCSVIQPACKSENKIFIAFNHVSRRDGLTIDVHFDAELCFGRFNYQIFIASDTQARDR